MRITKKVLAVALAAVTAVSSFAIPTQKVDAATKINAYLCFMSKSYNGVRSNHDDKNFSKGVMNGNQTASIKGIKVKNASIKKGKFTATVSVTGKNLAKFKGDKGWNAIYVDTSLAGTKKSSLKVTKAVLKMDGKVVKTIKNPVLTPDPGKKQSFTQVMICNAWNTNAEKKCKAASIKKMPTKSMEVTITGTLK